MSAGYFWCWWVGPLLEMFLCDLMLAFLTAAVYDGNAVRACPAAHSAAEAPCHPHKVRIVQLVIGILMQPSPPGTKATGRVSQPEVGI